MSLLTLRYPTTLPCPQTSTVAPSEKRQLSDEARPRDARALQRDRLELERITWPPLTAAQAEEIRSWWRNDLVYGGAWFVANWPVPRGMVSCVRRFLEQPSWSFVPGGFWALSALCEIRGVGLDPVRSPETISLLHLDGDLADEVGGSYANVPLAILALPFVDSAEGFGQQGSFTYSLGGAGQSGITRTYSGSDPLIDTAQWQIDAMLTLTAGGYPARTLVSITRDRVAPDVQTSLVTVQAQSASTEIRVQVRVVGAGNIDVPELVAGSRVITAGNRTHVRVTYRNGDVRQYHDGVLVALLEGVSIDASVASTTLTRISIGCAPAGGSGGPSSVVVFSGFMAGLIDEFRLASEVTDAGDFDVPNRPFTLPLGA